MKLEYHVAFSCVFAGMVYVGTRSLGFALGLLAGGVLIDLDHLIDYVLNCRFRVGLLTFSRRCLTRDLSYAVLLLHGWEYVILSFIILVVSEFSAWVAGAWAGFTIHMIIDQITNRPYRMSYFVTWRMLHGFRMKEVFPPAK